jgi:hypothetical protein
MASSTPSLSLDGPVPPGPSDRPNTLEMAAAAPLLARDTPGDSVGDSVLRIIGTAMIGVGSLAMLGGAAADRSWSGALVAAAVFIVIIGLAVRFPTMLQDGSVTEENRPSYSTMRVVVLLVVGVFVMLTVKAGWATTSLDALKVDQSWALMLGVVLGGKVVQGMAEAGVTVGKK